MNTQETIQQPEGGAAVRSSDLLDGPRPITPEDMTKEADRNYDLGRKHAKEELQPAIAALEQLYRSSSLLRVRVDQFAPRVKRFSEWERHTESMRTAENVLRPSNTRI